MQSEYWVLKKHYKSLIQRKKREFHNHLTDKVQYMRENDPNSYWKFWKKQRTTRTNAEIDVKTFTDNYSDMNKNLNSDTFDTDFMRKIETFIKHYKIEKVEPK